MKKGIKQKNKLCKDAIAKFAFAGSQLRLKTGYTGKGNNSASMQVIVISLW